MADPEPRIVLLIVNPYLVHCYWQLPSETPSDALLRFHRQSGDPFDIDIDPKAGHSYIPLWSADESIYAELMTRTAGGPPAGLVRSNVVHLPRPRPVTAIQQHFIKVEPEEGHLEVVPPPPAVHHAPLEDLYEDAAPQIPIVPLPRPDSDLVSIAEANLFPGLSSWR